eukprot:tig00000383_g24707.t1
MSIELTLIELADDGYEDKKMVEVSVRGKVAQSLAVGGRRGRLDETFRFPALGDGGQVRKAVFRVVDPRSSAELGHFELGLSSLYANPGVPKDGWFSYSTTGSVHLSARVDDAGGRRAPGTPGTSARLSSARRPGSEERRGGARWGLEEDVLEGPAETPLDFSASFLSSIDRLFPSSFVEEAPVHDARPGSRSGGGQSARSQQRAASTSLSVRPEDACVELDFGDYLFACVCVPKQPHGPPPAARASGLPRR